MAPSNTQPVRGRSRNAFWFFVVLTILGAIAIVVPIEYNRRQQLQPGDLAAARARWQAHGPRDYNLKLMRKVDMNDRADEYQIRVRNGVVTSVASRYEGVVLIDEAAGLALGPVIRVGKSPDVLAYTIEGLFDLMEKNLGPDAAGQRNFATASFDSRYGYPHHYVHRVAGTKQRLEWNAVLEVVDRDSNR